MAKSIATPNFAEYQTVREPAAELGVLQATLRNWDRSGKSKPLKIKKHQFRTVRGGFDAIEMASTFQPDMILIDVGMPTSTATMPRGKFVNRPKGATFLSWHLPVAASRRTWHVRGKPVLGTPGETSGRRRIGRFDEAPRFGPHAGGQHNPPVACRQF